MITLEQWIEKYNPIKNKEGEDFEGLLFQTYGEDKERVFAHKNHKQVWTLITGENETWWISPGYHLCNREGYFITEKEWEYVDIEVDLNEKINIGEAKYACLDFIEQNLGVELTPQQETDLHLFWDELI